MVSILSDSCSGRMSFRHANGFTALQDQQLNTTPTSWLFGSHCSSSNHDSGDEEIYIQNNRCTSTENVLVPYSFLLCPPQHRLGVLCWLTHSCVQSLCTTMCHCLCRLVWSCSGAVRKQFTTPQNIIQVCASSVRCHLPT